MLMSNVVVVVSLLLLLRIGNTHLTRSLRVKY
jgi:hypothetical protein